MTTTATPAPSSLDVALGKIDQLLAAPVLGVTEMTQPQLQEHAAAELEKDIADATSGKVEASKARLAHLKTQIATAKAIFDKGATLAPITMFKDPWQTMPGEGSAKTAEPAAVAAPDPSKTLQSKDDVLFVATEKGRRPSELLKALCVIAKASDKSPARTKLSKRADGAAIIEKAGQAQALLMSIATMFGIPLEDPADVLDYEFKWDISDTICALQGAAKLEGVMASMGAALAPAAKTETPPAAPPAVPAPAAAPPAPAPESTEKAEAWPMDMARAELDEKTGLLKAKDDVEGKLYWGRDTEKAPTL